MDFEECCLCGVKADDSELSMYEREFIAIEGCCVDCKLIADEEIAKLQKEEQILDRHIRELVKV